MTTVSRQMSLVLDVKHPEITVDDFSASSPSPPERFEHVEASYHNPHYHMATGDIDSDSEDDWPGTEDRGLASENEGSLACEVEVYGQNPDGQQRDDYKDLGMLIRRCGLPHIDAHIKRFWHPALLGRIVTRDRIVEELRTYQAWKILDDQAIQTDANKIWSKHRKIFAILVLIGKGSRIKDVIRERLTDKHLPLEARTENHDLYRVHRQTLQSKHVQCLSSQDWTLNDRDCFRDFQHALSPEILELEGKDGYTPKHKDFHARVVLPFKSGSETQQGGFGVVTRVTIPEDCHKFHALLKSIDAKNSFAWKQLINNDRKEFEDEAEALSRFNGFDNDHMVTLLMTWTLHGKFNLLFPWARCDLAKYWELDPKPLMEAATILWTSKQVLGIASAIRSIHNPSSNSLSPLEEHHRYGRHGDLKAENILHFDSPDDEKGILVVADLGLAKLNSIASRSAQNASKIPCTPRYKPPECDVEGAKISRSYDIWTFGCLLLEWSCWLFQGYDVMAEFIYALGSSYPSGSIVETFFDMEEIGGGRYHARVKSAVLDKLNELHKDGKCSQYFHELLFLIENEMLVIRAQHRISSEALFQRLNSMHQRAKRDIDYYYEPCGASRSANSQDPLEVEFRKSRPKVKPNPPAVV